ncbi:MAG: DnaJ domain-containing protein [Deltaproteobacteria bacterium]|nr:DnaJ domain-containing protein [Deltaproteobacteria bacterium]
MLALLGLPADATPGAIKQRYRELARRFHPDVNQTDARAQARFRAIAAAYERLVDEDPALPDESAPAAAAPPPPPPPPPPPTAAPPARPIPLEVTLAQVIEGARRDVRLSDGRVAAVDVPAGADTGTLVRPSGFDVLVEIRVIVDPRYSRRGTDLHVRVSITAELAWKGTRLELTTPSGPARVRVPERSRHGDVVRVIARGVPGPRGRGDLFVELTR